MFFLCLNSSSNAQVTWIVHSTEAVSLLCVVYRRVLLRECINQTTLYNQCMDVRVCTYSTLRCIAEQFAEIWSYRLYIFVLATQHEEKV